MWVWSGRERPLRWRLGVWFRRRWRTHTLSLAGGAPTGGGAAVGVRLVRPVRCGEPAGDVCLLPPPLTHPLRRPPFHGLVRPVKHITAVMAVAGPAVARTVVPVPAIVAPVRIQRICGQGAGVFPRQGRLLVIRRVRRASCIMEVTGDAALLIVRLAGLVLVIVGRVRPASRIIVVTVVVVLLVVQMVAPVLVIVGRVHPVRRIIVVMMVVVLLVVRMVAPVLVIVGLV